MMTQRLMETIWLAGLLALLSGMVWAASALAYAWVTNT